MWQCACSNFFLRQSKVMTECACHRLGFLASTWWVMACSPVISTQLALVKWMPASFRSIRESWRMSGKNYLTQITSKFWLWADASVFQLLQGLLHHMQDHARKAMFCRGPQKCIAEKLLAGASWETVCWLRKAKELWQVMSVVNSSPCTPLQKSHGLAMQQNLGSSRASTPAFKSVEGPSVQSLKPRIDRKLNIMHLCVFWQAVSGSRILPKLCLLWPRLQNRTERHAHCGWLLEWVVRRYESEASHRALCAFALTCTQRKTKLPKAINIESSTCLVPEDDTVGSGCSSVGL